jgi:hypothetical protein
MGRNSKCELPTTMAWFWFVERCSTYTHHEHAAWTWIMDMKHRGPETDMQHGHAVYKLAAWKSNRDMYTPYSRPLLFPLPSGLELWNPVSNVVRQREEKERISAFSLRSALLLFSRSFFSVLSGSFFFALAGAKARKKRGRLPLYMRNQTNTTTTLNANTITTLINVVTMRIPRQTTGIILDPKINFIIWWGCPFKTLNTIYPARTPQICSSVRPEISAYQFELLTNGFFSTLAIPYIRRVAI